jgi:Tfp pilus assembly protein PilF
LSDLLARNRQIERALAEASIALEYNPRSIHALGHLAHVAQLAQEFDLADRSLRRALEIEPGNEGLRRRLEMMQARANQAIAS